MQEARHEMRIPSPHRPSDQLPVIVKPLQYGSRFSSPKSAVVEMQIEGGDKLTVMVRDYDYHPITRELTHADFVQAYRINNRQPADREALARVYSRSPLTSAEAFKLLVIID